MEITYKNKGYEKVCLDYSEATKAYGEKIGTKVQLRIKQLRSVDTEEDLFGVDRCHPLKGKRKTLYAVELGQPWRLVFELTSKDPLTIRVVDIIDYHGKQV